tara:strand:+ start:425 stop:982 length:558 start_codon:yes stop_codon:yes gene_type:complete
MKKLLSVIAISLALTACGNDGETKKHPTSPSADKDVIVTSPGHATGDSSRKMGPVKAVLNKAIEDAVIEFALHPSFSKFDGFKVTDEASKDNTMSFEISYNRTFEKDLFEFEVELMKSKKSALPIIELAKRFGDTIEVGKPITQEAVITLENKDKKWVLTEKPFKDLSIPKGDKEEKPPVESKVK